MFASSSLEEVYHYVYYQLTSVALTMLDDVNGLSINFFSNEFIQAIVNFFTLFAWGLGLTGAAIAIMDFAVSYQTGGGGSFTGTGMNMLRLLVALLTFSSIPILLFQTSMDIYGTVRSVVVGSMDGATVSITDLVKGLCKVCLNLFMAHCHRLKSQTEFGNSSKSLQTASKPPIPPMPHFPQMPTGGRLFSLSFWCGQSSRFSFPTSNAAVSFSCKFV